MTNKTFSLLVAAVWMSAALQPSAASSASAAELTEQMRAAIQMLADVTLIDGECHDTAVIFGNAFRASEAAGLPAAEIMPTGSRRSEFETDYRLRLARTTHQELCGDLAKTYAADIPGLFSPP